jgi:hypothetical protein
LLAGNGVAGEQEQGKKNGFSVVEESLLPSTEVRIGAFRAEICIVAVFCFALLVSHYLRRGSMFILKWLLMRRILEGLDITNQALAFAANGHVGQVERLEIGFGYSDDDESRVL